MANVTGGTQPKAQVVASETGAMTAGKTTIDDGVVAKIAGIAAREVPGVFALGGGAVGRIIDGRLDVRALADVFRGRRSSS